MDDNSRKPAFAKAADPSGHKKGPVVEPKSLLELSLEEAARKTPPTTLSDTEASLDMTKLRLYRLGRLREQLQRQDIAACLLTTPHSIRYASGLRNCAIYQAHIPATYLYVPAEGPTVLFDSQPGRFRGQELETIDEISPDLMLLTYMWASDRGQEWYDRWAEQMAGLISRNGGTNKRLAIEHLSARAPAALERQGIEVLDAGDVVEPARSIKSPEEILCINHVIAIAEDGMYRMREALRPGLSETELWSHLWAANIEAGGDFIECRLLASGDRTNPWQQEA
ncbi:MAG: aminopeptidase P family N-terminal domain-containing protein, partial [Kiloniellales bacterium]|nr:aminopeptidase P family N-terminal domain-containing protein [Kiloniellales bacterium]